MFKQLKNSARKIVLSHHYIDILIPSILYMLCNAMLYVLLNIVIGFYIWPDLTLLVQILAILLLMTIEFICIPLSLTWIYRMSILAENGENHIFKESFKFMFSPTILKSLLIINAIPRLLHLVIKMASSYHFYFRIDINNDLILLIVSLSGIVLDYKLFASNYILALSGRSASKVVIFSWKIMKKRFGQYLLWGVSFIGWIALIALIRVILEVIVTGDVYSSLKNYNLPCLDILQSFGFGIDLYLIPYMYLTKSMYLKYIIGDTKWNKPV